MILPARHFTENRRWREMLQRADRFFNMVGQSVGADEVEERLAVLQRTPCSPACRRQTCASWPRCSRSRRYACGEAICAAGESASCVFAVQSGYIEVKLAGSDAVIAVMGPGDMVGEYGMFQPEGRTATLVAGPETEVLALDYQRFKRFLMAFPSR